MVKSLDIISIGEGLIELSSSLKLKLTDNLSKYFGGDCLAMAIAAKRSGSNVGFITKVGNDAFKEFLLDGWQGEGLDISKVKLSDEQNGLYIIAMPENSQKEIIYYRKKTAPSRLSIDDIDEAYIKSAKYIYSSGVTQALSALASEAVTYAFDIAQKNGVMTSYTPSFNPNVSTVASAKEYLENISGKTNIFFMELEGDVIPLLDIDSPELAIKKIWDLGAKIAIIKANLAEKYFIGYSGNILELPFYDAGKVDSTASFDAFNGGFLSALSSGMTPFDAAKYASIVEGLQISKLGAIKSIPYKSEVIKVLKGGIDE